MLINLQYTVQWYDGKVISGNLKDMKILNGYRYRCNISNAFEWILNFRNQELKSKLIKILLVI